MDKDDLAVKASDIAEKIIQYIGNLPRDPYGPIVEWASVMFQESSTAVWRYQYCKGVLAVEFMSGPDKWWAMDVEPFKIASLPSIVSGSALERAMNAVPHELSNHRHLVPAVMKAQGKGVGEWEKGIPSNSIVVDVSDYIHTVHGSPQTYTRLMDRATILHAVREDEQRWLQGNGRPHPSGHYVQVLAPALSLLMEYHFHDETALGTIKITNQVPPEERASLYWTTAAISGDKKLLPSATVRSHIEEWFDVLLKRHEATDRLFHAIAAHTGVGYWYFSRLENHFKTHPWKPSPEAAQQSQLEFITQ